MQGGARMGGRMLQHEYSMHGGVNRAQVGRLLAIVSASISAFLVYLLLSIVDLVNAFHFQVNLPPTIL